MEDGTRFAVVADGYDVAEVDVFIDELIKLNGSLTAENIALRTENKTYFNNCVLLAKRLKSIEDAAPRDAERLENLVSDIDFIAQKIRKLKDELLAPRSTSDGVAFSDTASAQPDETQDELKNDAVGSGEVMRRRSTPRDYPNSRLPSGRGGSSRRRQYYPVVMPFRQGRQGLVPDFRR